MNVSVVVPVYNEEKYLGSCLESLAKQSEDPDEIIIVDNNSTDRTVEIAQKYGARIITEKEQGMIAARNAGFSAAKGEIIARCDADTILPKDWIKNIKKHIAKEKLDGLTGPTYFTDFPFMKTLSKTTTLSKLYIQSMKWRMEGNDVLIGPNMIITRKAWELVKDEVCLDDTKVHEDIDLSIHMTKHGLKIVNHDNIAVGMSARRITHNPQSFFLEYLKRNFETFNQHQ